MLYFCSAKIYNMYRIATKHEGTMPQSTPEGSRGSADSARGRSPRLLSALPRLPSGVLCGIVPEAIGCTGFVDVYATQYICFQSFKFNRELVYGRECLQVA